MEALCYGQDKCCRLIAFVIKTNPIGLPETTFNGTKHLHSCDIVVKIQLAILSETLHLFFEQVSEQCKGSDLLNISSCVSEDGHYDFYHFVFKYQEKPQLRLKVLLRSKVFIKLVTKLS